MHAAIAEVGILYATATVHSGWDDVGADGIIAYDATSEVIGGHAFAIVAYDRAGLLDPELVGHGLGHDGLRPHQLRRLARERHRRVGRAARRAGRAADGATRGARRCGVARRQVRRLYVLRSASAHHQPRQRRRAANRRDVRHHAAATRRSPRGLPRLTKKWKQDAHCCSTPTAGWSARTRGAARSPTCEAGAARRRESTRSSFIWKTDYWTTITNILQRLRCADGGPKASSTRPRTSCSIGSTMRWSRWRARSAGKAQWDEMKENASCASRRRGRRAGRRGARPWPALVKATRRRDPHGRPQRGLDLPRRTPCGAG